MLQAQYSCSRPAASVFRGTPPKLQPRRRVRASCSAERAAVMQDDMLLRSLSDAGEVAVLVVDGTRLVSEAVARHRTAPTASAALGRTLLGTLLLASFRKEDEALQVVFQGDGLIGNIIAIADTRGNVKGKVENPAADPPLNDKGKLDVAAAVGQGLLSVVRSHPQEPNPITGIVPITCGEIAEDLATYLAESEQTNSALALGVSINQDLSVASAGGFLIQVLPFCSEETLSTLEQNLASMPTISTLLQQGKRPKDITSMILAGIGVSTGSQTLTPRYGPCEEGQLKERMLRMLASLGVTEVNEIAQSQGKLEVNCDFCQQKYQCSVKDVMEFVEKTTI